jgi:hypothetical protein
MRTLVARARGVGVAALFVLVLAAPAQQGGARQRAASPAGPIPERLSDADFWGLVTTMSEPAGFFRSDNLVSNELTFQHVIPALQRSLGSGGVYLGVGPDQNFTYLVALRPRIAFIVDIRRGNLHQHLLYKALIELSTDRADFLSRLFSRARPAEATTDASAEALMTAFGAVVADTARLIATLDTVRRRLVDEHRFALDAADLAGIEYVLQAFFLDGPSLTYSFGRGMRGYGMRGMPTYGELMVATDADGVARGYLASEENFAILKELEQRNLVVPVVGDFAGEKALRSVGAYLAAHDATVSAIYTSNVEQYLFQGDYAWRRYYANVAALPLDERSTFVRAVFNYGGYREPGLPRGPRSVTMLSPVRALLSAMDAGEITSYWDVIQRSASPVEAAVR